MFGHEKGVSLLAEHRGLGWSGESIYWAEQAIESGEECRRMSEVDRVRGEEARD